MDNDSGRGSRSNEPPKLATVRRLHLDDGEGSSATATEEWYETERLTGQITGRRNAPHGRPASASTDEALVVLDWRHAGVCAAADRASAAWPESRRPRPPRRVLVRPRRTSQARAGRCRCAERRCSISAKGTTASTHNADHAQGSSAADGRAAGRQANGGRGPRRRAEQSTNRSAQLCRSRAAAASTGGPHQPRRHAATVALARGRSD